MAEKPTTPVTDPPAGKMPLRRRLILEYGRPRGQSLRSMRERIVDFAKTMAWVAPMTLLIWIYAERAEDYQYTVPNLCAVEFQASGDRTVLVTDGGNGIANQANVLFTLEGPHSGVDAVTDKLTSALSGRPIVHVTLGSEYPDREQPLENISSLINGNSLFVRNGVTVKACRPNSLKVKIEKIQEIQVPVRPVWPPNVNLATPPVIDHPLVTVRGPESYFTQDDPRHHDLYVVADLTKKDELQQDGTHVLKNIALRWYKEGENVELSVDHVTVTVQTSAPSRIDKIPSILVWVNMPQGLQKDYEVSAELSVKNVQIKGPPGLVDELVKQAHTPLPQAVLNITNDDIDKPEAERSVKIEGLPAGVTVQEEPKVKFKLVKRNADGT